MESIIYYISLLINGKIIPQDFDQAEIYLDKIKEANDPRVFVLLGKICRKKKKFKKALKYFKEGMKIGNLECGYYYAKMAFLGEGSKKFNKKAISFFLNSRANFTI